MPFVKHQRPMTASDFKALRSLTYQEALSEARANTDFPCFKSDGTMLIVCDESGQVLVERGDCYECPLSMKKLREELTTIARHNPTAHHWYIDARVDGAESVAAFGWGEYEPYAGEACSDDQPIAPYINYN